MEQTYFKIINGKSIFIKSIEQTKCKELPTLIFLHEGLGSVVQWKGFPERLSRATGLNAIVYDRKGHGLSADISEKRTRDYLEAEALIDLRHLILDLKIKNPILIGHSDGGTIALIYAANFPVKAVITEAAHIKVESVTIDGIKATVKLYETSKLPQQLAKYHGAKTNSLFYNWADIWLSDEFVDWNIEAILPRIKAPVLAIQGANDEYATKQHLFDVVNKIGVNAIPLLIENCQHNPHRQQSEIVFEAMKIFIDESITTHIFTNT